MAELSSHQGKRIRIFIGEAETWHGRPLSLALLDLAAQHRVLGATIQRGIEGFGPEHHLSTERIIDISDNLPLIVEMIDTTEHIESLLTQLDPLVRRGVITVTSVEILQGREERG
jgi:PII-like signaling protein